MSKESVLYLLKKYHLEPNDAMGQNFLYDDRSLAEIMRVARLRKTDTVLEIGAGIGNLTAILAQTCSRVVAVEKDLRFSPILAALTRVNTNVEIVYDDILKVPFQTLKDKLNIDRHGAYTIVANIPYYMTSRILAHSLRYPLLPQAMFLLVQKEVAERIVALPGDHSKLSLSIQMYGEPEMVFSIPRNRFIPAPDVDSTVLAIRNVHSWQYPEEEKRVWQIITFGFSSKRKKLINNLMAGLRQPRDAMQKALEKAQIDVNARAQMLSVDQWRALVRSLDAPLGSS